MAEQSFLEKKPFLISDKILTFFIALNSCVILGLVALTYYSQIIYKKPVVTEKTERARLESLGMNQKSPSKSTFFSFDPITVNLLPSYSAPKKAQESEEQTAPQKPHFITVGLSIEIRDETQKTIIENFKPLFLDELIQLLGRRTFEELVTAQGRYILNSQIIDHMNQIIQNRAHPTPNELIITHAYFTQFVVQ